MSTHIRLSRLNAQAKKTTLQAVGGHLENTDDDSKSRSVVSWKIMLVLVVSLAEILLNIGRVTPDSSLYIGLSKYFLGQQSRYDQIVVMRPAIPWMAAILSPFFGLQLSYGLINASFWIGGVFVTYRLTRLLLANENQAVLASLLYTTSRPLLDYGAAVLTDAAGYFFIGLIVYLTFLREEEPQERASYYADGFLAGLALLFRETALFALVFMLMRRVQKRKALIETLLPIGVVAIILIAYLHALGLNVGIYFHKYDVASLSYTTDTWNAVWWVETLVVAFSPLIIFFPLGLASTGKRRIALLGCLVVLLPVSLIWPVMSMRFSFCMYPCVIPVIVLGFHKFLSKFGSRYEALLVSLTFAAIVLYNNYKVADLFGLLPLLHS